MSNNYIPPSAQCSVPSKDAASRAADAAMRKCEEWARLFDPAGPYMQVIGVRSQMATVAAGDRLGPDSPAVAAVAAAFTRIAETLSPHWRMATPTPPAAPSRSTVRLASPVDGG